MTHLEVNDQGSVQRINAIDVILLPKTCLTLMFSQLLSAMVEEFQGAFS